MSELPVLQAVDFAQPEVARFYDELPLWSAPFGQLILDRVPLRAGAHIVDIGSGTGFLTVELAQRSGASSVVTAVDPWHEAMTVLRAKCEYLGLRNVRFAGTDASTLELADASVDVVVSNLGINNFDDPPRVLAECRRVLRPDGVLLMTSNLQGHMQTFYDVYRETLLALELPDRLPALDSEITHRATVESAVTGLKDAGFDVPDVATGSFSMRYADGTALLRHYFIRLGFLAGWRDVAGEADADRVLAGLEQRLNAHAAATGGLDLTVPTACFTARPR